MNVVRDVLAQEYSALTGLFSFFPKLQNSDASKRLLVATNPDSKNGGDSSGPSGSGST